MKKRSFLFGLAAMAASFAALPSVAETLAQPIVEIASGENRHLFKIEVADSPAERSRGLMHRLSMPADAGMLFIYPREQIASFWMKNTYIPLDMLFIAQDGRIVQIAQDVVPHSLTPVRSAEPVRAVLEINGGLSAALGVEVGDRITLYR